ncbi:MAG: Holliday junction resolvase RuvX [Cyanobacteria bacterium J06626_14]
MSNSSNNPVEEVLVGFDPGRDKCGLAVMGNQGTLYRHEVVTSSEAIATLNRIMETFPVQHLVLGDQTTSQQWKEKLQQKLSPLPCIHLVDERYSTLEARDRYWKLYPPKGLQHLIPKQLRTIPRPVDDVVAMILIERYLAV